MAFLDPVNTIATKDIMPGVTDQVFRNSPLLAHFRKNNLKAYNGGPSWQENILYNTLTPEGYFPGESHDLTQRQLATGTTVTPRYYNVSIPATLEKLKIEMNGPPAVFSYIDLLLQTAALSMSAKLANDVYRHGQNLSGSDRSRLINGLDEALSDGTTNGFEARTYPTYLTLTRNSATEIADALNSPMTGPGASVGGAVTYPLLEESFQSVVIGAEKPDLIVTTNKGFSYLKMAFQAQQRFETTSPDFGFQGIQFNGAKIWADQYCPGSRTAGTYEGQIGYSTVAAGETLWILNSSKFSFFVSTDSLYGFGFTGFIPTQHNSQVVGHYKFCGNFTCSAPRFSRYHYAITG